GEDPVLDVQEDPSAPLEGMDPVGAQPVQSIGEELNVPVQVIAQVDLQSGDEGLQKNRVELDGQKAVRADDAVVVDVSQTRTVGERPEQEGLRSQPPTLGDRKPQKRGRLVGAQETGGDAQSG